MGSLRIYSLAMSAILLLVPTAAMVGCGLWGSRPSVPPAH
jgi:hypothetical protein